MEIIYGRKIKTPYHIFKNNPYVDKFIHSVDGDIFHDQYRIYDIDNPNIPLVEQMLKFWQFDDVEMIDSQPEMYWTDEEKEMGDYIIKKYAHNKPFATLLISDRFGTKYGKYDEVSTSNKSAAAKYASLEANVRRQLSFLIYAILIFVYNFILNPRQRLI